MFMKQVELQFFIQRKYHIGYNRAARLIDMLESHGFVSEARGSKPRESYTTEQDLILLCLNKNCGVFVQDYLTFVKISFFRKVAHLSLCINSAIIDKMF
ncbi:hypothetical protein LSPH24S_09505 [Lysinibacillus sphaericus]